MESRSSLSYIAVSRPGNENSFTLHRYETRITSSVPNICYRNPVAPNGKYKGRHVYLTSCRLDDRILILGSIGIFLGGGHYCVQTGSEAHPVSCLVGTRGVFSGGKVTIA